jgi:hypothetical protein
MVFSTVIILVRIFIDSEKGTQQIPGKREDNCKYRKSVLSEEHVTC